MMKKTEHLHGTTNTCSSGKRAHSTRRDAKAQARSVHAWTGEHLRPYICSECAFWHIGHLPRQVLRGQTTADSHYRRRAS